ncbi:MAG: hypothetical protein JXR77_16055 [Lentisphaeria bacterium]|nr:hypothetical protein [Lentisphaeria bacterium]
MADTPWEEIEATAPGKGHPGTRRGVPFGVISYGGGILCCATGAVVLQGLCMVVPVTTVPVRAHFALSAVAISAVCLHCGPPWGPLFAAFTGLLADVYGPGLPGTTSWAYVIVPVISACGHHLIRTEALAAFAAMVMAQTLVQTTGSYVGLRLGGMAVVEAHRAGVSVVATALLTVAVAVVASALLRFSLSAAGSLRRHAS